MDFQEVSALKRFQTYVLFLGLRLRVVEIGKTHSFFRREHLIPSFVYLETSLVEHITPLAFPIKVLAGNASCLLMTTIATRPATRCHRFLRAV